MTYGHSTDTGHSWEIGDWCFFEFKLCQIKRAEMGRVNECSDGMFTTSGYDLADRCIPLTLRAANITQHAQHWADKMHAEGHAGLNYPGIHNRIVELWVAACGATEGPETNEAMEKLSKFAMDILKASKEGIEIDGVPLLRHRAA